MMPEYYSDKVALLNELRVSKTEGVIDFRFEQRNRIHSSA